VNHIQPQADDPRVAAALAALAAARDVNLDPRMSPAARDLTIRLRNTVIGLLDVIGEQRVQNALAQILPGVAQRGGGWISGPCS
jgi:hypothetical protein